MPRCAMASTDLRWNLNIRCHRLVVAAVRPGARNALDVGTGDGLLAFDLADHGLDVVGIDIDKPSVLRATADPRATPSTRFVVGDVFEYPFELASFDVVASIAPLHHFDAAAGLRRMRDPLRPGGTLVVVGFARPSSVGDRARAVGGAVYKRTRQIRKQYWEHGTPTLWPPPLSSAEIKAVAAQESPVA